MENNSLTLLTNDPLVLNDSAGENLRSISYLENIQTTLNACDSYYGYPGHVQFLSKTFEDFDCNDPLYPDFVGRIFREFRVTDLWGNGGTFLDTIYLWRLSATNLICPPDTSVDCSQIIPESDGTDVDILWSEERFYTDATSGLRHPFPTEYSPTETGNYVHGFPAPGITYQIPGHPLDTVYLDGKSLGKCNLVVKFEDMVFKTCGTSYKIRRWWTIYDWCTGVEENCVQWIKITLSRSPTRTGTQHRRPRLGATLPTAGRSASRGLLRARCTRWRIAYRGDVPIW